MSQAGSPKEVTNGKWPRFTDWKCRGCEVKLTYDRCQSGKDQAVKFLFGQTCTRNNMMLPIAKSHALFVKAF